MSTRSPKRTKYKSPHFRLGEKGLKGYKIPHDTLIIKTKESFLLTPKHLEAGRRILAKTVREKHHH